MKEGTEPTACAVSPFITDQERTWHRRGCQWEKQTPRSIPAKLLLIYTDEDVLSEYHIFLVALIFQPCKTSVI